MAKPKKPESLEDRLDRAAIQAAAAGLARSLSALMKGRPEMMIRQLTRTELANIAANTVACFILKRAEQGKGAELDQLVAEAANEFITM